MILSYESRNIKEIHSECGQTYTFIDSASRSQIKIILSPFCTSDYCTNCEEGGMGWDRMAIMMIAQTKPSKFVKVTSNAPTQQNHFSGFKSNDTRLLYVDC